MPLQFSDFFLMLKLIDSLLLWCLQKPNEHITILFVWIVFFWMPSEPSKYAYAHTPHTQCGVPSDSNNEPQKCIYVSLKDNLLSMKSSKIYGHYDNSASPNKCYCYCCLACFTITNVNWNETKGLQIVGIAIFLKKAHKLT